MQTSSKPIRVELFTAGTNDEALVVNGDIVATADLNEGDKSLVDLAHNLARTFNGEPNCHFLSYPREPGWNWSQLLSGIPTLQPDHGNPSEQQAAS